MRSRENYNKHEYDRLYVVTKVHNLSDGYLNEFILGFFLKQMHKNAKIKGSLNTSEGFDSNGLFNMQKTIKKLFIYIFRSSQKIAPPKKMFKLQNRRYAQKRERARLFCVACRINVRDRYSFREHEVTHKSEQKKCKQCKKTFATEAALKCYVFETQTASIIFVTCICGKNIPYKDFKKNHTKCN